MTLKPETADKRIELENGRLAHAACVDKPARFLRPGFREPRAGSPEGVRAIREAQRLGSLGKRNV